MGAVSGAFVGGLFSALGFHFVGICIARASLWLTLLIYRGGLGMSMHAGIGPRPHTHVPEPSSGFG